MAHARKGKKKISKVMGEILKAPKKVEKAVKHASKHWNDIHEFRQAVSSSGMDLDVDTEYEFFKSDPENFKKTNTYKNLLK
jgi:hypothetical protein